MEGALLVPALPVKALPAHPYGTIPDQYCPFMGCSNGSLHLPARRLQALHGGFDWGCCHNQRASRAHLHS